MPRIEAVAKFETVKSKCPELETTYYPEKFEPKSVLFNCKYKYQL